MVIALKINFELDKSCLLILANYKETLLGFGPFFILAGDLLAAASDDVLIRFAGSRPSWFVSFVCSLDARLSWLDLRFQSSHIYSSGHA